MNDLPFPDSPTASPPPPADELISRYFDEPLSAEEHELLTRLLRDDPGVRQDFAAMARLNQGLEGLAPRRTVQKKRHALRWMALGSAAAAAAVLMAGGGWALFRQPASDGIKARVSVADLKPPPADAANPAPLSLRKRTVKAAGATALTQPDLEELLSRYYVNVSPHGLTVPQALRQLPEAIRAVNVLNRPALNQLSFTVGPSVEPGVEDPMVRTPLPAAVMTVKAYLETCGLFRQVTRQPGNVVYGSMPESGTQKSPSDGGVITKVYRVPPDFLSGVQRKQAPKTGTDPFRAPDPGEQDPTAWDVVTDYFLGEQPEGTTVTFSPDIGHLTVRGLIHFHDLLDQRLGSYWAHRKTPQVFVTGKICSMPKSTLPAGFDEMSGMILNDPEWQAYMRTMSVAAGLNLYSMPSILIKSGQRSRVEIIREVTPAVAGAEAQNIGLTVGVEAQCCGEMIRVLGTVEPSFMGRDVVIDPTSPLQMDLREPEVSDGKVHAFPTEYELWLPDHSTGIFTLDVPLKDSPLGATVATMCLSAVMGDETGIPLNGQNIQPVNGTSQPAQENADAEIPYGIAIPGKPGFVKSPWSAEGEVDVTGIARSTWVRCPYTKKYFRVP